MRGERGTVSAMARMQFVVNVEGPESDDPDFVLGPYEEIEADEVCSRLHERLTARDPDFRVWVSDGPDATTEDDVYHFFGIDTGDG